MPEELDFNRVEAFAGQLLGVRGVPAATSRSSSSRTRSAIRSRTGARRSVRCWYFPGSFPARR